MTIAGSTIAVLSLVLASEAKSMPSLDAAEESVVRASVYNETPRVGSNRLEVATVQGELFVPKPLADLYKANPRGVLEALSRIIDGARPDDSALAAGYALSLLTHPGVGVVCVTFFEKDKYDIIDKDWEETPRQHWLSKIREKMKAANFQP
jgi:hypothetical protein